MSWSGILRTFDSTRRFESTVRNIVGNAFGKHLLFTNIWTSGALMFIGDIAQQEIEYHRHMLPERYDWNRIWRMTLVGFGYGPLHHYFYIGIDRIWPTRSLLNVGKKIIADQVIMSPVCIAFLFYCAGILEHKSLEACTKEIKDKFVDVYKVDWCVWPPTQFINFYYIPLKYQILYINAVTMFYNVFLSYMKHKEVALQYLKNFEEENLTEEQYCDVK